MCFNYMKLMTAILKGPILFMAINLQVHLGLASLLLMSSINYHSNGTFQCKNEKFEGVLNIRRIVGKDLSWTIFSVNTRNKFT